MHWLDYNQSLVSFATHSQSRLNSFQTVKTLFLHCFTCTSRLHLFSRLCPIFGRHNLEKRSEAEGEVSWRSSIQQPPDMSNAIGSSRESNPSRRTCHLRAVPLGHVPCRSKVPDVHLTYSSKSIKHCQVGKSQ